MKLAYNSTKNVSIGKILVKPNFKYYLHVFFEDDTDSYSRSHSAKGLAKELSDLMSICQYKLLYTLNLQKQEYDKGVKP